MTRPEELLALATRVEIGEDGRHDRPLAEAIYEATGNLRALDAMTSLDAVERLRENLLPGSLVRPYGPFADGWSVSLWPGDDHRPLRSNAPTEPRARLAAILRALAAKEGQ